jgi:hypothetical protein
MAVNQLISRMHKMNASSWTFTFVFFILGLLSMNAQDPISDEKAFEERYARNIKKSRINGVYIPKDINEAIEELKALSTDEALLKFKYAEEEMVAKKLHFGLGRWIIYNWNFYEGSRFAHYLKGIGVNHPDDQAKFIIICLHRSLNDSPLEMELLAKQFQDYRAQLRKEKLNSATIIKEEKKVRPKND